MIYVVKNRDKFTVFRHMLINFVFVVPVLKFMSLMIDNYLETSHMTRVLNSSGQSTLTC